MNNDRLPVLILNGTVGAGKSTAGLAVHDVLSEAGLPHTFLDLDHLTFSRPKKGRFNRELLFGALASLWPVYKASGSTRLVVARAIVDESDLVAYEKALGPCLFTIVRLKASTEERVQRLTNREFGEHVEWFVKRTVELDGVLDESTLQFVEVVNEDKTPHEVAREILDVTGWIDSTDAKKPVSRASLVV